MHRTDYGRPSSPFSDSMRFNATTHALVIITPVACFLVQALNLISNALKVFKCTRPDWCSVCSTETHHTPIFESPTVEIGAPNPCAGTFRIEVEDNGPGVPETTWRFDLFIGLRRCGCESVRH